MARKKANVPKIRAEAIAKAEVVAKATYQRKHVTKAVVPPDVMRAKAHAWLDIISPITEWAGLKGDALKFKRNLLRIQQDETLLRVAQGVRNKLAGESISHQIPRKLLIPALEKASLEDADDDAMIDRWANLLASAAQDTKVQPRFVGILEEMTGRQAACLERVAFNQAEKFNYPATVFADSFLQFAEYHIRSQFEQASQEILTNEKQIGELCDTLENTFNRPGVYLSVVFIAGSRGDLWDGYDAVADRGVSDSSDLSILESLGLVRHVVLKYVTSPKNRKSQTFEISVHYYHLTNLGVEFCEVCSRTRVAELEKIGTESRKKRLEIQEPFTPDAFGS